MLHRLGRLGSRGGGGFARGQYCMGRAGERWGRSLKGLARIRGVSSTLLKEYLARLGGWSRCDGGEFAAVDGYRCAGAGVREVREGLLASRAAAWVAR